MALVITSVVVEPRDEGATVGDAVDVRIVGDRVERIEREVAIGSSDEVIDANGGSVIPGLHDHHVHLRAWAAARSSVSVDPAHTQDATALGERLRSAPGAPGSWVRATGYHESVAGLLDRDVLDALVPDRPVRLQHRSGVLWILNSRALELLRIDELGESGTAAPDGLERDDAKRATGRLWRADRWLHDRRLTLAPEPPPDLGAIGRRAAAAGITGFTDATPDLDEPGLEFLLDAHASGALPQRLHLMGDPAVLGPTIEQRRTAAGRAPVTLGALKRMLDDDRLPALDALVGWIGGAHERHRPVALHCVTAAQSALAVAAWKEAGVLTGDRMEHGALLGPDLLERVAALGIIVVTQPGFVFSRGDRYLADVDVDEQPDLWRLRSLLEAGIEVGLSSDAPLGPDDPWTIVRAAGDRTTRAGSLLTATEAVAPRRALSLFWGEAARPGRLRTVRPGALADLVVLAGPLDQVLRDSRDAVTATIVGGRVAHRPDGAPGRVD